MPSSTYMKFWRLNHPIEVSGYRQKHQSKWLAKKPKGWWAEYQRNRRARLKQAKESANV